MTTFNETISNLSVYVTVEMLLAESFSNGIFNCLSITAAFSLKTFILIITAGEIFPN